MSFALLRSASVLYLLLSSLSRCILGYFQTLVDDSKCRWCQHRFWQEAGQRLMETVWKQDGNMLTDFIIALRIHCHLFLLNDFLQLKQTTHTERGFLKKKTNPTSETLWHSGSFKKQKLPTQTSVAFFFGTAPKHLWVLCLLSFWRNCRGLKLGKKTTSQHPNINRQRVDGPHLFFLHPRIFFEKNSIEISNIVAAVEKWHPPSTGFNTSTEPCLARPW